MAIDAKYIYVVMMDVDEDTEADFNAVYDNEHVPILLELPEVISAVRYKTSAEGVPRYVAIYEVANPGVPDSDAFKKAADIGEWATKIRPHTKNRSRIVYERIDP